MSGVITEGSCSDLRKLSLSPLFIFYEFWWQPTAKVLLYCHLQSFILLPHPLNQTFSHGFYPHIHLTSLSSTSPLALTSLLSRLFFSCPLLKSCVLFWSLLFLHACIRLQTSKSHNATKSNIYTDSIPNFLTDEHANIFANCSFLTVCVCVYILLFVYFSTFASIFCF